MSEVAMLIVMMASSVCPVAFGIGIIVGIMVVVVKRDTVSTLMGRSVMQPPECRNGFTWVHNVPESGISEVITAMERGGRWRYGGRTHAGNATFHVRFTRPDQDIGQQAF